jgi:predicted metalloprotease with PDZ domain
MKQRVAVAIFFALVCIYPVAAMTLNGTVVKTEAPSSPPRTWWQKLFGPEPEGRIGVRISSAGRIDYVHPASPAEEAGLQANDVVLVVDGRKHDIDDISGQPGTIVHLQVQRHSHEFAIDVKRVDYHCIVK